MEYLLIETTPHFVKLGVGGRRTFFAPLVAFSLSQHRFVVVFTLGRQLLILLFIDVAGFDESNETMTRTTEYLCFGWCFCLPPSVICFVNGWSQQFNM